MTFLQLINKVLVRLREETITTAIAGDYPTMIAQFINEAKEDIEDVGPWKALHTTVNDTLVSGTATLDLTADTNERSYLLRDARNQPQSFITTVDSERRMTVITQAEMDALRVLNPDQPNATPIYVSFSRASTGMTAEYFPTPDAAYTVRNILVVPQDDLTAITDELSIPGGPVWRRAVVMAMEERGEEFSGSLDRAEARASEDLRTAILADFGSEDITFWAE